MGWETNPFFILNFHSGSRIIMRSRVELPVFVSGPRSGARARISSFYQYSIFFSQLPEFSSTSRFSQNWQPLPALPFFPSAGVVAPGKFFQRTQFLPVLPISSSFRRDAPKGHLIWPSSAHSSGPTKEGHIWPHPQASSSFFIKKIFPHYIIPKNFYKIK